jgi:hypothetical protein
MVGRGTIRAAGILLSAYALMLIGVSSVVASPSCVVNVTPKTGVAGSLFTFQGSGFEPDQLSLSHAGTDVTVHELAKTSDPWTLAVRSRPGDEGKWTAQFSSSECSTSASFTVTLTNTDADAPHGQAPAGSTSAALLFVVVGAGAAGGVFLGRRLGAATSDNSAL